MAKISRSSDSVMKVLLKKGLKEEFESFGKKIDARLNVVEKKIDQRFKDVDDKIDVTEKSQRIDLKLTLFKLEDRIEQRVEQKLTKFRDSILTAIDPLLAELDERRRDREPLLAKLQSFA